MDITRAQTTDALAIEAFFNNIPNVSANLGRSAEKSNEGFGVFLVVNFVPVH